MSRTTLFSTYFAQYHNNIVLKILWTTYSVQHCKLRGNIIHTDSVGRTTCPLSSVGWYDWLLTVWWTHQWQLHWLMAAKHFYIYGHRQKMENYFGKFLFIYINNFLWNASPSPMTNYLFSVKHLCRSCLFKKARNCLLLSLITVRYQGKDNKEIEFHPWSCGDGCVWCVCPSYCVSNYRQNLSKLVKN